MIIPAGVLVEFDLAPAVARILAEAIRRDPQRDSDRLRRLLADLTSARTSVASVRWTSIDGTWLTPQGMSERFGKTDRTWRRRAKAGLVEAVWEDGRWWIKI